LQGLAIVKTASPAELVRVGENLFRPLSQPRPVESERRQVVGGFVESSGTSATTEMVELLETSRLLEANLNILQAQDQMLGGMISRLTRTS
jgi:flagellar basal-body rod protein FlgF